MEKKIQGLAVGGKLLTEKSLQNKTDDSKIMQSIS